MENTDLFIIFAMSILSFLLFAIDKHKAVYSKERLPEALLLLTSLCGGAFGGLCGMIFFNHKTANKAFLCFVPLFVVIILAADILYRLEII